MNEKSTLRSVANDYLTHPKRNKGITLIALVVTIIVLLILAGISIAMLTGQNGILNRATDAKNANGTAQIDEQVKLAVAEALSNGLGTITDENLRKTLDANVGAGNYELTGNATKGWTIKAGDKTYNIDASGVNSDDSGNDDNKGNGETGKLPSTEVTKPYLPGDDFEKVDGTDIDTGLVIKDKEGNEWVWIEVPQTEEVYKTAKLNIAEFTDDECNIIYNDLKVYTVDYSGSSAEERDTMENFESVDGITRIEYYKLRNDVLKSIYIHGGFWLARYEAGVKNTSEISSDDAKIYIQKGCYPYTSSFGKEETIQKMQKFSKNLNSGKYSSSLMFGVQWDLILKFIETKGALTQQQIKEGQEEWGNFDTSSFNINDTNAKYIKLNDYVGIYYETEYSWKSVYSGIGSDLGYASGSGTGTNVSSIAAKKANTRFLLSTGASERNCVLNIYDLAGNEDEQTLENNDNDRYNNGFIYRGGNATHYREENNRNGVYYRSYYSYRAGSFRPIMY